MPNVTVIFLQDLKMDVLVEVSSEDAEAWRQPLLISVRQQITNTHIKLPFTFDENRNENA